MSRWPRGEAEIEQLLASKQLQQVAGGQANGEYSATALLAQQGLRPTTSGGHYAVEVAVRAQFGDGFRAFGAMRRRRNELEYPSGPGETTTPDEASAAITDAGRIHRAAQQLLTTLPIF